MFAEIVFLVGDVRYQLKKKCKVKHRIPLPNKYPDNCPKMPDMDEYIRIDKIPCRNCKLPFKKTCKNDRLK